MAVLFIHALKNVATTVKARMEERMPPFSLEISGIYENTTGVTLYLIASNQVLYLIGSLFLAPFVYSRCGLLSIFKIETLNFRPKFRNDFIDKTRIYLSIAIQIYFIRFG
jgi:hypothetical protein